MKDLIRLTGVFLLLLLITSCEKEDPDKIKFGYMDRMPAETRVGANSFGCYINGEIAAAQGVYQKMGTNGLMDGLPYVNGFWYRYTGSVIIPGTWMFRDTIITEMNLRFYSRFYNMQIILGKTPVRGANKCLFYLEHKDSESSEKSSDSSVEITFFDKKNQIISGRFDDIDFQFKDLKVHITKGQFDVKYGKNFELP